MIDVQAFALGILIGAMIISYVGIVILLATKDDDR